MKQRWSSSELAQFQSLNGGGKRLCGQRTRQGDDWAVPCC